MMKERVHVLPSMFAYSNESKKNFHYFRHVDSKWLLDKKRTSFFRQKQCVQPILPILPFVLKLIKIANGQHEIVNVESYGRTSKRAKIERMKKNDLMMSRIIIWQIAYWNH